MDTLAENPTLSINSLIEQMDAKSGCGVDVRTDEEWLDMYTTLRDTRKELRRAERTAISEEQPVNNSINANWDPVILQSMQLLQKTCKDVEITAWLIEGLVRRAGINGLLSGYAYLKKLLETFGNNLHPHDDADSPVTSLNAIQSLSGGYSLGTLILPLNIAPWFEQHQDIINNWNYSQAGTKSKDNKSNDNQYKLADLDALVMKMELRDIANLRTKVESCIKLNSEISDLSLKLDPENGVSLGNIRTTLDEILDILKRLQFKKNKTIEATASIPEPDTEEAPSNNVTQSSNIELISKQAAIEHLKKAYEYFRMMQPHSPVTYSLARSIEWCDMSLSELLDELMPNNSAKKVFCKIAGVPVSSENSTHESASHFSDSE